MPELVKLYIRNVAIGFGIAAGFVAGLLWFDVAGLWQLVSGSSSGLLAVFMLWFMNGIVFAGVQFAWAVMALAEDDNTPRRGTPVAQDLVPVRVSAAARSGQGRQIRR
jgi:hypothetical protein